MRSPIFVLVAVLAAPSFAATVAFDSGLDPVAQAREALIAFPVPTAPIPLVAPAAPEPELAAFPSGSDRLPFGKDAFAQGHLSFKLTARLSPWDDHDVITYVEVCDRTLSDSRSGSDMGDPMENVAACHILVFRFGDRLRTDLKAHRVLRGARTVASIVETPSGPELDWGPGGVAARLAYRVEDERVVVTLKN